MFLIDMTQRFKDRYRDIEFLGYVVFTSLLVLVLLSRSRHANPRSSLIDLRY